MDQAPASVDLAPPQVAPVLFGTIVFLASELLLFGGLFAAYFTFRAQTTPWPPKGVELNVPIAAVGTLLLLLSSGTYHLATRAGERQRLSAMRWWVVATFGLGAAFLGLELYDWLHLDFEVSSHAYGTMYYTMTGIHGLHVLAGLVLMLVVLGRLAQGAYRGGRIEGAHAIGYYWHFVDVVWIALFATIFILR
jgi:cytochrome c oxidase subunit III